MEFAVPADHRVEIKENEKIDKYFDVTSEKKMEHESDGDTNINWCTRKYPQKLDKRAGRIWNWTGVWRNLYYLCFVKMRFD